MNNIEQFSNIIKNDYTKCNYCLKCIHICDTYALSLKENRIKFDSDKCYACKKCIQVCPTHALYYNVNDGEIENINHLSIIPYNANPKFIENKCKNIVTNLIGEKVKVVETAFEMEKNTSNILEEKTTKTLIISDIENLNLYLKLKDEKLEKYLSNIHNSYVLSGYIYRLKNMNKDLKVSLYGVPFEAKPNLLFKKSIDEICDIPYKSNNYYSPIDILNMYMSLCKLKCDEDLNRLTINESKELILYNKYLNIKVLLTTNTLILFDTDTYKYNFVFVLKNNSYPLRDNLLYDEEVNNLYKTKLKSPLSTKEFFRK